MCFVVFGVFPQQHTCMVKHFYLVSNSNACKRKKFRIRLLLNPIGLYQQKFLEAKNVDRLGNEAEYCA